MEHILSVGIDLGTTTMQMIVSYLNMENTAGPFAVPNLQISSREIVYRSKVRFTPLISADTIDAEAVKNFVRTEYQNAGILPEEVQTGAVIITGETARKENAREVLRALSDLAGDFVVATAGPALESVLAAKGAGADQYARAHGVPVLHFDIGGGTSNLALYGPEGQLLDTGCLNVGGRLLKFDENGAVTYVSPVLDSLQPPKLGGHVTKEKLEPLVEALVQVLEEAAGLRPRSEQLDCFITDKTVELPGTVPVLSFSGGVADLISGKEQDWRRFGDLGVLLGAAIGRSRLCRGAYILGRETIRATVVGAGSHSTELSGSTVAYDQAVFPLKNLPVIVLHKEEECSPNLQEVMYEKLRMYEQPAALWLEGTQSPPYTEVQRLAESISSVMKEGTFPVVVVMHKDMAKALGQALFAKLGRERAIVCLDGLTIPEGSYLDVNAPVAGGAAVPVVVKTLAFI